MIIYPGETITIAMPLDGNTVGTPHATSVVDRDGETVWNLPEHANGAVETMRFEFQNSELGYTLTMTNGADATIKYDAFMQIVEGEELKFGPTSSCPVNAHISVFEFWPHPIVMLLLSGFRVLPENDSMVCS